MILNKKSFRKLTTLVAAFLLLGTYSCNIDDIPNPNGPSVSEIINNASRGDLNVLVSGIEALMINDVHFYYDVTGIVGREFYFFTSADTRFTGEILGKGLQVLDNAGFYATRPYQGRYRTIKNTNILIEAVENPTNITNLALTNEEISGFLGFAKATQAYELSLALMLQYQNGIRLNVKDPDNLGDFVSLDDALAGISALLDEAISDLSKAGTSFAFPLSPGYDGFNTPATFAQFVNGIAARIAIYQSDKSKALNYLNNSFMDMNGDLNAGPARFHSTVGGEQLNQLFRVPGQSEAIVAHPDLITSLQANPDDLRNAKLLSRGGPVSSDGLTSDHDVSVYTANDSPIPFMRNEELILLAAEANIGIDNGKALEALNVIRNRNNIASVSLTTDAELIDELLNQRRFSLLFEGHRWVDMRRYGRLDRLPIDRVGDDVWVEFPRPDSE